MEEEQVFGCLSVVVLGVQGLKDKCGEYSLTNSSWGLLILIWLQFILRSDVEWSWHIISKSSKTSPQYLIIILHLHDLFHCRYILLCRSWCLRSVIYESQNKHHLWFKWTKLEWGKWSHLGISRNKVKWINSVYFTFKPPEFRNCAFYITMFTSIIFTGIWNRSRRITNITAPYVQDVRWYGYFIGERSFRG